MAGVLQHLRSSTLNKRPNPSSMVDGQVAINYASGAPGMFFKDSNGALVKVGPVHVGSGAPNAVPASGGTAGNSLGEQWLDTSGGTYVFKIWDGSAWRSEAGEFVNVTGDTMTGALGIIAGSASSPSLFFSGDTNTGLYSPGADQVAISTNGTGRLFVDASGRVGVNNASPAAGFGTGVGSLDVNGPIFARGPIATHQTDAGVFQYSTNVTTIRSYGNTSNSGIIAFNTGGGGTADTERMRLDSSGRLGLGSSTPSSVFEAKGLSAGAAVGTFTSNETGSDTPLVVFQRNGGAVAGAINYKATTSPLRLDIGTTTNHSFAICTNNTPAITVNTSQQVGIGTTSPSSALTINNDGVGFRIERGSAVGYVYHNSTSASADLTLQSQAGAVQLFTEGGSNQPIKFITNGTERGRWDSNGRFLVGTSSTVGTNAQVGVSAGTNEGIAIANSTGATRYPMAFLQGTTYVGSISTTGSATAYNTSSDYRLKENIQPLTGAITRLQQLPVHRFNFIADPDTTVDGFIAHEAQAVVPECVTGEKDAVDDEGKPIYQGIDQSKLVPLLTAALQEAIAKIETLEAKVAALEGV